MKILFVSSTPLEYSASSNMRNIALLKGFIENGHQVKTITPKPQYDAKIYDETICDIDIKEKYYIEMGEFVERITFKKEKKSFLKEMVYKILLKFRIYDFRSTLANKKIKINEKFDLLISSSDPKSSHLIAEKLVINNPNITQKWIQYWGDPFADDINKRTFMPKIIIKKEERRLISICDEVVYVSPFTLEQQKKNYPEYANKMRFLPIPYMNEKIYNKILNRKITLGYFGNYNTKDRNILPLYESIAKNQKYCLNICGNSDIKLEEKENIAIRTRQKMNVVEELEEKSDILVCMCNKKGTQIPGKIYHYAATNKPILIILDGERKEELREYFEGFNRYKLCENTEQDIVNAIEEIKNSSIEYKPLKILNAKKIAEEFVK